MLKRSIAAQLYTVRDYMKTPEEIKKGLKALFDMGYRAVQVSKIGSIDPKQMKDIVDEIGMTICATHIPWDRLNSDVEGVINEHLIWGTKYVGLSMMPEEYRAEGKSYRDFTKKLSDLQDVYGDSGLKLIYHNHSFEFEKFDGVTGMDILLNESKPDSFGFEIDTYWIQAGGADPVDWIKRVKGRMDVVHFKDMAIFNDKQHFAEIGQGNLNWEAIIKACEETGVTWYAIEQDVCRLNPFDSLKMSFEFLSQYAK